jgi:glucose/arabinose dehydrogenase
MLFRVIVVITLLSLAGHQPDGARAAEVSLVEATGFIQSLFVAGAATDNSRLYVVEKPGRIKVVEVGEVLETSFLDTSGVVNGNANERGLLGLAFHPDFESNGRSYVHYNDDNSDIVIAGYSVSDDDPNLADKESQSVILKIPHRKAANHNGGMLAFGPKDGYLYISVGDGGGGPVGQLSEEVEAAGENPPHRRR